MTQTGGEDNEGTIFSLRQDGANYQVLHNFEVTGGRLPNGSLIYDTGVLYGMTYTGGDDDLGTIFSINENGTAYTPLHHFAGGIGDGSRPKGSLILIGSTLFGMTSEGGSADSGVLFSIGKDGEDFEVLYEFSGDLDDGGNPLGDLLYYNDRFYGTTSVGGASELGTVFSIGIDGEDFLILHEFSEVDGELPESSLVVDSGTLYGVTPLGGADDLGVVFAVGTDGENFKILREFTGSVNDGANPHGALLRNGSKLYGLTNIGGADNEGTLFSINNNGSDFTVLYSFTGGPEGENPLGALVLGGSYFHGLTSAGTFEDEGAVFRFLPPVNSPGGSPSASSGTPGSCTSIPPTVAPDLFQVNTVPTEATLYFSPVLGATNYLVSYGMGDSTTQFSVFTNQGESSGVLSYKVNALFPTTLFSFNIAAFNGCAQGPSSNTMTIQTTSKGSSVFYKNVLP